MKGQPSISGSRMELEMDVHQSDRSSDDDELRLDLRGVSDDPGKSGYDYVETARTSESGGDHGSVDLNCVDDDEQDNLGVSYLDDVYDNGDFNDCDDPLPIQLESSDPSYISSFRHSLGFDDGKRSQSARGVYDSRNSLSAGGRLNINMGDRVFKTPMTFSPRMNGELGRPSPSRVELWKEELGLNETGSQGDGDDSSNSDAEPEVDQNTNKQTCSIVEYHALLKELEERNTQRDDLLIRIKMLTNKNKTYRSRLEKDEASKKQQFKILTHAHQLALQEKDKLIENLEEVASEQEQRISELETRLAGKETEIINEENGLSSILKLSSHIKTLQAEKADLQCKVMTLERELEEERSSRSEEEKVHQRRCDDLKSENDKLRKEVNILRAAKKPGDLDLSEKPYQLELDNDKLHREIQDLKSQLETNSLLDNTQDTQNVDRLQEENGTLKARIAELDEALAQRSQEFEQLEASLRQELNQARESSRENHRRAQELGARLTALQARSPEVVTRVHKVEVECEDTKQALESLHDEHSKIQLEHGSLQHVYETLQQEHQDLQHHNTELQQKHSDLQQRHERLIAENENLKVQMASKTGELEEVIETKKREKVETDKQLEELHEQCLDKEQQLDKASATVADLQHKVAQLESELEHRTGRVDDLTRLESELTQLREGHAEQLAQLSQDKASQLSQINEAHAAEIQQLSEQATEQLTQLEKQKTLEMLQFEEQKASEMTQLRHWLETAAAEEAERLRQAEREAVTKATLMQQRYSIIAASLQVVKGEVHRLKKEYRKLNDSCQTLPHMISSVSADTTIQVVKAIQSIHQYNQDLVTKYRKEMALRKKYHNELVELKGNIRVFCRLRPRIKEDGTGSSAELVARVDHDDDALVHVSNKGRVQSFELDRVFDPSINQQSVFNEVQALVTSCIDGFNVCIFAYGQTGSGKTYTMEGTEQDPGINQRALQQLFSETEERGTEWDYCITVSMVEIYNESLRDLLNHDSSAKLDIKMSASGLYVPGLTSKEVTCVSDVNKVFGMGHRNRATATTNMNEHSSRSHALLCITVVGRSKTTGSRTTGKLNLVDLAGSERVSKSGADGARLKEAQNINRSLSCIGDVIHALRSKQSHIPYRNSKLTYLLQDSLGGDSKTLMIVQVSPVEKNVSETLASLNFAQRVRSVELGQATRKVDATDNYDSPSEETPNGRSNTPNNKIPVRTTRK